MCVYIYIYYISWRSRRSLNHTSMPVICHTCQRLQILWLAKVLRTTLAKLPPCQADGLEFVVCDMKKQYWDNPPDWYGKKNYQITVPWTPRRWDPFRGRHCNDHLSKRGHGKLVLECWKGILEAFSNPFFGREFVWRKQPHVSESQRQDWVE